MNKSTQRTNKRRSLQREGVVYFSAWVLEKDVPALLKYADNPEVVKLLEEWEKKDG